MCSYGWFLPEKTEEGSVYILTHWRVLQQKEKLSIFVPTAAQFEHVSKIAAKTNNR